MCPDKKLFSYYTSFFVCGKSQNMKINCTIVPFLNYSASLGIIQKKSGVVIGERYPGFPLLFILQGIS